MALSAGTMSGRRLPGWSAPALGPVFHPGQYGPMRALLAAAAATALAAGCGGPVAPRAHKLVTAPASTFTRVQACRQLREDVTRNGGSPDILALRRIADHVTAPRLAADARTAVRDISHTGIAPVALTLLRADCAQAGVRIPAP